MLGKIYRLYSNKGFGFIKGDEDPSERFFHAKWCEPLEDFSRLKENDSVEFEPDANGTGGNKLRAMKVKRA